MLICHTLQGVSDLHKKKRLEALLSFLYISKKQHNVSIYGQEGVAQGLFLPNIALLLRGINLISWLPSIYQNPGVQIAKNVLFSLLKAEFITNLSVFANGGGSSLMHIYGLHINKDDNTEVFISHPSHYMYWFGENPKTWINNVLCSTSPE